MSKLDGIVTAQADCEAEVINLSLGITSVQPCSACGGSPMVKSYAIQRLMKMGTPKGKHPIYVASTGNDSKKTGICFPASLDDCLAVGAVESTRTRSSYSNFGPQHPRYGLAPGGEKNPTSGQVTENVGTAGSSANPIYGTSPAAAYASGFLALLKSDATLAALSRDAFIDEVWKHHTELPQHARGKSREYGRGILKYNLAPSSTADPGGGTEIWFDEDMVYIGGIGLPRRYYWASGEGSEE